VQGFALPANGAPGGASCAGFPCWRSVPKAYSYRDRDLTPDGIVSGKLTEGLHGKTTIKMNGKGGHLNLPDLGDLNGVLDVQVQRSSGGVCWGATFTPPFRKNDGVTLLALSDAPPPPPPAPVWSAIHAQVIDPVCSGCHGFSGGLEDLDDCNLAHANLVDTPSSELPAMDRIEPTDPTMSWLMHKLDGTHDDGWFACEGGFCGQQMPLGGELPLATRDAIRTWITNGAVNDCP
jgi:hypothetical protein